MSATTGKIQAAPAPGTSDIESRSSATTICRHVPASRMVRLSILSAASPPGRAKQERGQKLRQPDHAQGERAPGQGVDVPADGDAEHERREGRQCPGRQEGAKVPVLNSGLPRGLPMLPTLSETRRP